MKKIAVLLAIVVASLSFAHAETGKITNTEVINQTGFYCPYGPRHCFGQGQSERVTVQLGNMKYTAEYGVGWASGLVVGDTIETKLENDKLILTNSEGKTEKKKIVRRERVEAGSEAPTPAQATAPALAQAPAPAPVPTATAVAQTPTPTPAAYQRQAEPVTQTTTQPVSQDESVADAARLAKQHKACLDLAKDNPSITCK